MEKRNKIFGHPTLKSMVNECFMTSTNHHKLMTKSLLDWTITGTLKIRVIILSAVKVDSQSLLYWHFWPYIFMIKNWFSESFSQLSFNSNVYLSQSWAPGQKLPYITIHIRKSIVPTVCFRRPTPWRWLKQVICNNLIKFYSLSRFQVINYSNLLL